MKNIFWLVALVGLLVPQWAMAQGDASSKLAHLRQLADSLHYQDGKITLQGDLATISLPPGFRYLDATDANTLLTKLWGNPPDTSVLGMLVPAGFDPLGGNAWAVVISYEEEGHVADTDANTIDYAALMEQMKAGTKEANEERAKQGYPAIELIGWAKPPYYDAASHKMYWAKEIQFGNEREHTLNYDIRILGRRGVLVLSAVAGMPQLPTVEAATPQILSMINFKDGNRYADFNPSTDKMAAYGLAALVAGGIAAKAGFFKILWVGLLAAKKFVIIAVVAVVAFVKKMWGKISGRS